jgi:hypothetical protein
MDSGSKKTSKAQRKPKPEQQAPATASQAPQKSKHKTTPSSALEIFASWWHESRVVAFFSPARWLLASLGAGLFYLAVWHHPEMVEQFPLMGKEVVGTIRIEIILFGIILLLIGLFAENNKVRITSVIMLSLFLTVGSGAWRGVVYLKDSEWFASKFDTLVTEHVELRENSNSFPFHEKTIAAKPTETPIDQPVSTLKIDYMPSANARGLVAIPAPKVLSVQPIEAKVLPGRKSTDPGDSHWKSTDGINDEDRIGNLGIASLWCQNSYYNDGKYNDNNWKVVRGVLKANAMELDTYTIHPADHNATEWTASKHALFHRFKEKQDYMVYELNELGARPVANVEARKVKPGQFVRLGTLHCNGFTKPHTFVIVPASIKLSTLHTVGEKVTGGMFGKTPMGHHVKLVFTVNDTPYDTQMTYTAGPADRDNRYGQNRRFFPVSDADQAGVIWQAPANGKLYVSWFAKNFDSIKTALLPHDEKAALASATSDGKGTLYYVMIGETSKVPAGTRDVRLYRTNRDGSKHQVKAQDAKKTNGGGLNVWKFGTAKNMDNDSALQYSDGKLGMILARRMHLSDDGLNHQGAIAVVFDAEKLTVIKNHGQTSGHSFETFLTIAQDSRFLGVDLGDNYPRGVNLHRFDSKKLLSRVVHTYKTKHGEEAKNPAGKIFPPFNQPLARKRLFQWSNDNNNYTEIGGVVESTKGFAVVFSSENHKLDNAKAVSEHNGPRNLGLVLVRKDFENAAKGESSGVITDDLVLSKGDVVTGGYYSFRGKWMPQRTAGVHWLTDYSSKGENASRVKVAPRADGKIAVFWEQWSGTSYKNTFGMVINADGTIAVQPVPLKLRLGRRDDPFVHDDKIIHVSGNETSKTLTLDTFITP